MIRNVAVIGLCLLATSLAPARALAKRPVRAARPPSIKQLRSLGYSPLVARQIVKKVPALATKIIARRSRPRRLFRGIDIERSAFRPTFVSTDPVGKLCLTDCPRFAVGYAANYHEQRLRHGERQGVMLELQVPSILLEDPRAELVFKIDQSVVPDVSPFLKRIGTLDLRRVKVTREGDLNEAATLRAVKWKPPTPARPR